ncbi:Major facilitator superfamily protein [Euphorbia peplus]|nr:Major facilitator superfamily protein [Euphorbia peplus]
MSKPALVVLGLVFAHGLAKNAVIDALMLYLTEDWKKPNIMKSASIVNIEEAISSFIAIIIYILTETWVGRFKMVLYTSVSFILGLVLLWLSTWAFPLELKTPMFYVSLLLISFGKAGKDPSLKNFLRDQLFGKDEEQIEDRATFLWRVFKFIGAAISVFFLAGHTWNHTFLISASVMGAAYLMFLAGIFCPYTYTPPTGNHLSSLYKVVKYAFIKRCLPYEKQVFSPDPIFRCLDRPVVVTQASRSQRREDKEENVYSHAEVRQTKSLLKLIPLWFGFFIYGIVTASGNTFFIEQSSGLRETIPINSFFIIISFISSITSYLANLLLSRFCRNEPWRLKGGLIRVGTGMAIAIVCCHVASVVEHARLDAIKIHGDPDEHEDVDLYMSILWLAPQFILLGLMDGLAQDGLSELFYIIADEWMEGLETPINQFMLGIGKAASVGCVFVFRNWFGDTINKSRLDKYFNMLMYLSIGNLVFYLVIGYYYVYVQNQQETVKEEKEEEEEKEKEIRI